MHCEWEVSIGEDNTWWFPKNSSLFLVSDILLFLIYWKYKWSFSVDLLCVTVMAFFFFLVVFRCHHLCGWHVQLPGLPCLCAPTLALWWWTGLSKWKWWTLHSRLWYEHAWGCLWKNAVAASSDIYFCSTHHITLSLTFPTPGLIGSIRFNQVGCCQS